ncbi:MAG: tRNA preQ1(34) S-adenosylmethionine ribosyltransferase-isomerase QueA, partial [Candidatus Eiseniibacteriota bacterium]
TGALHDARIAGLGAWLRPGDALALNETRVRPARLELLRSVSRGRLEILFVRPVHRDGGDLAWRVLARPAKRAREGERLETPDGSLEIEVVESGADGERVVRVTRGDLERTLGERGDLALPPYIHHAPGPADRDRYQTVYARVEGAIAAPTAGLHFTGDLLRALASQGVAIARTVLHVGPGTFRPITSADPAAHRMDEEYYEVSAEAAATLAGSQASGGRIVAVGTTVARALESACDAHDGRLAASAGWTRKFILPPYTFRGVDVLLTNFHLPRTTLLLLVAAFAGEALMKQAYAHAVAERYRFYSYGDAMLVV